MKIIDSHTHRQAEGAVVNASPGDALQPGILYSMGYHPWNAAGFDKEALEKAAKNDAVVAIGETGFDALRGPLPEVQAEVLKAHALLAERLGKPLIIHCVKCVDRLLKMHRELKPSAAWIFHGFRGKPQQALQLVRAGFYLSLGPRFNPASADTIPDSRLLIETDDSGKSIYDVAAEVAAVRGGTPEQILELNSRNFASILQPKR